MVDISVTSNREFMWKEARVSGSSMSWLCVCWPDFQCKLTSFVGSANVGVYVLYSFLYDGANGRSFPTPFPSRCFRSQTRWCSHRMYASNHFHHRRRRDVMSAWVESFEENTSANQFKWTHCLFSIHQSQQLVYRLASKVILVIRSLRYEK